MEEVKEEKKLYSWTQTDDSLTVTIPMKRVPASKVDVYLSSVYVKINAPTIKLIVILDLLHPISYTSPKNRVQMRDEFLELYLQKVEPLAWPQLCLVDKKEAIKIRREESVAEEKKYVTERAKITEKKKLEMDKHTFNQYLELEESQRNLIRTRKEEEKHKAEDDVYRTLEELEKPKEAETKQIDQAPKRKLIEEIATDKIGPSKEEKEIPTSKSDIDSIPPAPKKNDIFTDNDVVGVVEKQPKIRERSTVKIGFTEKQYPMLAARETYSKEPPLPKSAQAPKKENDKLPFEEKNPLWLKEKGDNFFANNDFISALNAYNKAIEGNAEFLKCILNRATCFIKLRAYRGAITDCEKIEAILAKQKKEEDEEFFEKMSMRGYLKKGAAHCWLGEFKESLECYDKALSYKKWLNEKELNVVTKDIQRVKNRIASIEKKNEGDALLLETKLPEAIKKYEEGLAIDPESEYLYANLSLAHLKLGEYDLCVNDCNQALKLIRTFQKDSASYERDHKFEVKLLLRRGRCYDVQKNYKCAKEDLDYCIMHEPENTEAKNLLRSVQKNLNAVLIEDAKSAGQKLQAERKFAEALEKYEECLKISKKETSLDNITIYVNKVACLLSLGKHDRVLQDSDLALRMVNAYKNKLLSGGVGEIEEAMEKIKQIEIRLFMRKANAHAKLQNIGQAIEAASKALELDPKNESIQKDLKILKDDSH